jgi:hypothetical protein
LAEDHVLLQCAQKGTLSRVSRKSLVTDEGGIPDNTVKLTFVTGFDLKNVRQHEILVSQMKLVMKLIRNHLESVSVNFHAEYLSGGIPTQCLKSFAGTAQKNAAAKTGVEHALPR